MQTQIDRVRRMESVFDEAYDVIRSLKDALKAYDGIQEKLRALESYYQGPEWRMDFEADERGDFPADLKRGVLSEDAVYDLLTDNDRLKQSLSGCRIGTDLL